MLLEFLGILLSTLISLGVHQEQRHAVDQCDPSGDRRDIVSFRGLDMYS